MPGLIRGMARTAVVAGTASAVAGGVASAHDPRAYQQQAQIDRQVTAALAEQQAAAQPTPPAAAPAGGLTDDSITRLPARGPTPAGHPDGGGIRGAEGQDPRNIGTPENARN